jgi:hypothetical protein
MKMNRKGCLRLVLVVLSGGLTMSCPQGGTQLERETSAMTFTFIDSCDDGIPPALALYDVTSSNPSQPRLYLWGIYRLSSYDLPEQFTIDCVPGHKICYGAWIQQGQGYWGCGPECRLSCDNCCMECDNIMVQPVRLLCGGGIKNEYGQAPWRSAAPPSD